MKQREVAEAIGVHVRIIQDYEYNKKRPGFENLQRLADFFGVSVDYLLGKSVKALIEQRLNDRGMTWVELAERTGLSLSYLEQLDTWIPEPMDYEEGGSLHRIAQVLDMPFEELAAAFARQEPPLPDQPRIRAHDAFREERDIARELERIMESLDSDAALAFDGEPLDEQDKELLRVSLENSIRLARQLAKQKFTPKKYRKD